MVVALKPLHDAAQNQAGGGLHLPGGVRTGQKAVDELAEQVRALLSCQATKNQVYPHRIAFNCLPHIDVSFRTATPRKK